MACAPLQSGAAAEVSERLAVQSADLAAARGELVDVRTQAAALRKEVSGQVVSVWVESPQAR